MTRPGMSVNLPASLPRLQLINSTAQQGSLSALVLLALRDRASFIRPETLLEETKQLAVKLDVPQKTQDRLADRREIVRLVYDMCGSGLLRKDSAGSLAAAHMSSF